MKKYSYEIKHLIASIIFLGFAILTIYIIIISFNEYGIILSPLGFIVGIFIFLFVGNFKEIFWQETFEINNMFSIEHMIFDGPLDNQKREMFEELIESLKEKGDE